MDQDDPEQRIAELERQLAVQKRGADLRPRGKARKASQPASPKHAAASRRFVATTSRMQTWLYICTYGSWAAFAAVFVVMIMTPSARTAGWVVVVLMAVGLTLFGVLAGRWWGWTRKIAICVTSDGLTVEERPGEVFSFKDAKLGRWTLGQAITVSGTALHLQCGPHRFVLGGRDHRLGTGTPLQAPHTGRVDGWLRAADFDEVLTMVARRSGLDVGGPAPGEPFRCLLYPPYETMGPVKFLKQRTPQPRLAIDVGTDAIRVIDPNTDALVALASRAQVTATPANYRVVSPEESYNMPVLVVCVPSLQPLTIECRRAWRGEVLKEQKKPEFRVSDADSRALVEKFGLAANLKD
ncbi:hypothetical protein [Mycolicibacterium moriokaense]|nr:hypothetical protein [Mycolicibacterium moriokaense]